MEGTLLTFEIICLYKNNSLVETYNFKVVSLKFLFFVLFLILFSSSYLLVYVYFYASSCHLQSPGTYHFSFTHHTYKRGSRHVNLRSSWNCSYVVYYKKRKSANTKYPFKSLQTLRKFQNSKIAKSYLKIIF